MTASRPDGRQPDQLRPVKIELGVNVHAEGSCLVEMGRTRVWITASVEDRVPPHRRGTGHGWITAEYSMLPRSTHDRGTRESIQGRLGGRTHEIQRLIGRSLRAAVDMGKIGERTITLDCDVLQADGGTRTASISVTLDDSPTEVRISVTDDGPGIPPDDQERIFERFYRVSASGSAGSGLGLAIARGLVELQATAEGAPYTKAELQSMLALAEKGIKELIVQQKRAIAALG